MRPRLVPDCVFAAGQELVHVRSNRGAFVLRGKHVAGWLDQLWPYLDGRRSLEALTASLPAAQREDVRKLIDTLVEQDVVHDLDLALAHGLTEQELARARPAIAYLDSRVGSGAHHVERFRDTSVWVEGSGVIARAIAARVRSLGCHRVEIASPDSAPPGPPGLVVHCSEDPAMLIAANRASRSSGTVLLPIHVVGDAAWIGPLVRPDQPGCWECSWRRRGDRGPNDGSRLAEPIAIALVANRAAVGVFAVVTQAGQAAVGGLIRLDLETGLSERHTFDPHPLCEACGSSGARAQAPSPGERWSVLQSRADVPPAGLVRSASALVDPACGILRAVGGDARPQLPYRTTKVVVASPLPDRDPDEVVSTADTLIESRARAIRRALARYGLALCERRLAAEHGADGWDLVRDAPGHIPAHEVRLVGGSGSCWAAALASAVFEHSVRLLDGRPGGSPGVDLDAASLADAALASTRRLATAIGLSPTLLDLTRELGLPTVAAVIDGVGVAYAAAVDQAGAARLVMEAVISRRQVGGADPAIWIDLGDAPGDESWRALVGRLFEHGWHAFAVPLDDDPAVSRVCPHLVAVALVRRQEAP